MIHLRGLIGGLRSGRAPGFAGEWPKGGPRNSFDDSRVSASCKTRSRKSIEYAAENACLAARREPWAHDGLIE